jgi:hypothetical protein
LTVTTAPGERVQIGRQCGDQGLALTGLHLGDVVPVQCRPAHDLDVEVAFAEHPLGRLADGGERLEHQVVQRLAVLVPLLEFVGLGAELLVAHRDEVLFDGVDALGDRLQLLQRPALAEAEHPVHQSHEFALLPSVRRTNTFGSKCSC